LQTSYLLLPSGAASVQGALCRFIVELRDCAETVAAGEPPNIMKAAVEETSF